MADLGHRLAMARHAKKLRQVDVARAVGITQKHLSQIEGGHVLFLSLSSGTVLRLAELLGVSTDYLLGRIDDESELEPAGVAEHGGAESTPAVVISS